MPTIQRRHNRFRAVLRVPTDQQDAEGKAVLYKTMAALTKPLASLEAMAWEVEMKTLWQARRDLKSLEANPAFRSLYLAHKARAEAGDYTIQIAPGERDFDAVDAGLPDTIRIALGRDVDERREPLHPRLAHYVLEDRPDSSFEGSAGNVAHALRGGVRDDSVEVSTEAELQARFFGMPAATKAGGE